MRIRELPTKEYENRIERVQNEMKKDEIDIIVCYGSECESGVIRYLTGFWPFFDFVSLVIPQEGEAVLMTGGPESYDFAEQFSKVKNIEIHPLLVETCAPNWIRKTETKNYSEVFKHYISGDIDKIGISNFNIFPHILFEDLKRSVEKAEIVYVDELLLKIQLIKNENEVAYIEKAYAISEESFKEALDKLVAGMEEWELEAIARKKMLDLGAEGMPYPAWVCSGNNTRLSLCRSTSKKINRNELIQCTFGAKYMGYCGNFCRPLSIGAPPQDSLRLMKVGLEGLEYALANIKPGKSTREVYKGYRAILSRYSLEDFALYGPAHSTGNSEVEGSWMAGNAEYIIKPNMLFNLDIWISDGKKGVRFEDGILITETGIRELTSYKREVIIL